MRWMQGKKFTASSTEVLTIAALFFLFFEFYFDFLNFLFLQIFLYSRRDIFQIIAQNLYSRSHDDQTKFGRKLFKFNAIFLKVAKIRKEEVHVQPLTMKFITTAVSRVCDFEYEFVTLAPNCTMLLGYEAILNTVEGFYWLFLISFTCR